MLQSNDESKASEEKICTELLKDGVIVEYIVTEDRYEGVKTKKCVLCWNNSKNDYVMYNLDEWDLYVKVGSLKAVKVNKKNVNLETQLESFFLKSII